MHETNDITYQLDISYISSLPLAHFEDTTRIINDWQCESNTHAQSKCKFDVVVQKHVTWN